jgi:hypothetical protein
LTNTFREAEAAAVAPAVAVITLIPSVMAMRLRAWRTT